jgi:hypothetical protein
MRSANSCSIISSQFLSSLAQPQLRSQSPRTRRSWMGLSTRRWPHKSGGRVRFFRMAKRSPSVKKWPAVGTVMKAKRSPPPVSAQGSRAHKPREHLLPRPIPAMLIPHNATRGVLSMFKIGGVRLRAHSSLWCSKHGRGRERWPI